jgi:hypothetical protein
VVASAAIALVGVVSGAVRLLPWLLTPAVPLGVAAPFARGLLEVAMEVALLVGWPVGWALAVFRFVENGEARVLLILGERPLHTVGRLLPQGAGLAAALAAVALVYGSDATSPGRVANELLAQARASCDQARAPTTYSIPFTAFVWLCAPGHPPRLVGAAPGALGGAVVTAHGAQIAGDFRSIELSDARVFLPGSSFGPTEMPVEIHASSLRLLRMVPWARASTLPVAMRAPLVAVSAWATALIASYAVLRRAVRTRLGALVLGASGPLVALGLLRLLERADAQAAAFLAVPLTACVAAPILAVVAGGIRAAQASRRWRGLRAS